MATVTFKTIKKGRAYLVENPSFSLQLDNKGKLKRKRAIRYVEGLESIYVDEQIKIDPDAKPTSIRIDKSRLRVDDQKDPALVWFLQKHSRYDQDFTVLDVEKEDLLEVAQWKATAKASEYIRESDDITIRALAMDIISPSAGQNRLPSRLRLQLKKLVEGDMEVVKFVNGFQEDNFNSEKLLVSTALSEKIINLAGKAFTWGDSDEKLFTASQALDAPRELCIWLKNDEEGRQVQASLTAKLKETVKA